MVDRILARGLTRGQHHPPLPTFSRPLSAFLWCCLPVDVVFRLGEERKKLEAKLADSQLTQSLLEEQVFMLQRQNNDLRWQVWRKCCELLSDTVLKLVIGECSWTNGSKKLRT
jgi:hypothetical protein